MDKFSKESFQKLGRTIPVALWAFLTVIAGAASLNEMDAMHIIAGLGSMIGTGFVVYKFIKKEMEGE